VLGKAAEEELAAHIRCLSSVGFPCSRKDVRNLAFQYAKQAGLPGFSRRKNTAGYYWFRGFLARHKDLVVKKAENLSVARAMSMNKVQITDWFTKYKKMCTKLGITDRPSHLWNVDETGCQNIHKADAVVGVVGKPSYNITALERGETSTALICINAVGVAVSPMVIHKGKLIGKQWKNGARRDVQVRASENGYITKEPFSDFGKTFVEFLTTRGLMDGVPHLLIMDSHYSHLYNLEFLEMMKKITSTYMRFLRIPATGCSRWTGLCSAVSSKDGSLR